MGYGSFSVCTLKALHPLLEDGTEGSEHEDEVSMYIIHVCNLSVSTIYKSSVHIRQWVTIVVLRAHSSTTHPTKLKNRHTSGLGISWSLQNFL